MRQRGTEREARRGRRGPIYWVWLLHFVITVCYVMQGFEWNKYNQTHYDIDNPPPKIVQGYKFNVSIHACLCARIHIHIPPPPMHTHTHTHTHPRAFSCKKKKKIHPSLIYCPHKTKFIRGLTNIWLIALSLSLSPLSLSLSPSLCLTHTHTHTHTPVSYTHLTLPTRRTV